jgi:lipoate-protein ligase A
MTWYCFNSGPGAAAFNMALDETLLESVASLGRPVLRFYGWADPAATFGHLQKYAVAEAATVLRPLIRRPTGGGVVPHDADWTYSVAVPPGHEWYALAAVESYRRMHVWIQKAFASLQILTELAAASRKPVLPGVNPLIPGACFVGHEEFDLLWHGRKIAGAAQRRNLCGLLIQGSIQPPGLVVRRDWENAMIQVARTEFRVDWQELLPDGNLLARAQDLVGEKFSRAEYNQKR